MNINKGCRLFLRDVFLYDITACHYQIIQRLGYYVKDVPTHDKLARNTYIGLMMRENPRLVTILRSITSSTIDEYLLKNNISDDNIIIRQYDGFISTKILRETNLTIPIDLKASLVYMLISSDRKAFMTLDSNNNVTIKGVPFRYEAIDDMLKKLMFLNYGNKEYLFKGLQKIKDEILLSEDSSLYCIPTVDETSNVFLKKYGEIQISNSFAKIMDSKDIDKERYFEFYIRPFTESILIEFL